MVCLFGTYCSTIHDQSHLSGLVDVTPEGDARTDTPVAAVVRSSSKSWQTKQGKAHTQVTGVMQQYKDCATDRVILKVEVFSYQLVKSEVLHTHSKPTQVVSNITVDKTSFQGNVGGSRLCSVVGRVYYIIMRTKESSCQNMGHWWPSKCCKYTGLDKSLGWGGGMPLLPKSYYRGRVVVMTQSIILILIRVCSWFTLNVSRLSARWCISEEAEITGGKPVWSQVPLIQLLREETKIRISNRKTLPELAALHLVNLYKQMSNYSNWKNTCLGGQTLLSACGCVRNPNLLLCRINTH